ncbi:heat shock protein DnaJ, partial [Sporormia fimetaria CBS 119925]
HYAALGLTQSADAAEIKKAYRKLVIQTHPDKFVSAEESVQKLKKAEFQKLQAAYEILGDEDKRQKYD